MHNPTRRVKRFKQPLSSTRPLNQLPLASDTGFHLVPGEDDSVSGSIHVRHRHAAQPDALRSAILVALIVVTIVLYFVLWELERSSFAPVPKANFKTQGKTAVSQPSDNSEPASTPRYSPAVVDWRARDGQGGVPGEEANLSQDHVVASSRKPGRTTPHLNAWPPPVTRVPEDHATEDLAGNVDDRTRTREDDITKLSSFDAGHCHGTCRFLLPVRIGEQESKARVHLMQVLVLAKRLGRTVVLPNVGKSRMSACSEWPFDAYYDTNGFMRNDNASDSWLAIDLRGFAKWVDERPVPPSSFVVAMESLRRGRRDLPASRQDSEDVPFIVEKTEVHPKMLSCLGSRLAQLRSSLPEMVLSISVDSRSLKTESDGSDRLAQLLSDSLDLDTNSDFGPEWMMEPGYGYTPQYTNASYLSLADIDVLVLDYDLRHPLFAASAQATFNLHYAPPLYDLADRLSDNLGPFLGVHWRMEGVPVQNLAWCAASLVSTLHALLHDDVMGKDVRHVWLATDHPRPLSTFIDGVRFPMDDDRTLHDIGRTKDVRNDGPMRKSSTFKTVSLEHDDAIGVLVEAFQSGGELEAWKLTDLAGQLRRYPYVEGRFDVNETLLGDSGVFGILDKLVVVQARVFVSGSTDCSKTSSFSKQVIETRQELFETGRGGGAIGNVVEYFGKW